jgi:predicted AlkP superfamily pyrophosphatase or phosphodiesterase
LRKPSLIKLFLAVILALILLPDSGSRGKPSPAASLPRPKLILILVIDQLRYDYLVRFRPQFVEGGFNLLLGGANFVDCRYDYTTTATGPGHATLLTGAYPNLHGIVGNEWYDRSLRRSVNCVEDPTQSTVGGKGMPASPRNLIGSTLGDELRLVSNFESKVIAISLKDRGAILPGGHMANAAYWYDSGSGHFVTSTYYMQSLPAWASQFNEQSPAKAYCGKKWQVLPETPGGSGRTLSEFRPAANESCPDGRFLGWLDATPFMTEVELNFVLQAIENEHLGKGPATDLLAVSLSENDYIGHAFGPYSLQVADVTLRTDRYLADFFKDLDRSVGLDNVWIALSADHGVSPNYPFIEEHHLAAANVQPEAVKSAIEEGLSQAFGKDRWVAHISDHYDVYLDGVALRNHHVDATRAEAVAAEAAGAVPGVLAVFTRTQFLTGNLPNSPLARKASNSFESQRSGDVLVIPVPYAIPTPGKSSTAHGTPWSYDSQVPLVLWGSAFKPGAYPSPCQPVDLAPTIAAALGITQPSGAYGQPLIKALKQNGSPLQ